MLSLIFLFLGIALLVLIHVCVVGRAFRAAVHAGGQDLTSGTSTDGIKMVMMSKEDLKNLPCFDYKEPDKGGSSKSVADCVVCLEKFKVGESCRLLPNCNHNFHAQCIDSWLMKTPICPICRTGVTPLKIDVVNEENHVSIEVNDVT